jgi:hypothetical protein
VEHRGRPAGRGSGGRQLSIPEHALQHDPLISRSGYLRFGLLLLSKHRWHPTTVYNFGTQQGLSLDATGLISDNYTIAALLQFNDIIFLGIISAANPLNIFQDDATTGGGKSSS